MKSARDVIPGGKLPPKKKPTIRLPLSEFEFSYSRSSGPGGQNVNKVNSRATIRWNIAETSSLSEAMKRRFLEKFANRLTKKVTLSFRAIDSVIRNGMLKTACKNWKACLPQ